MLTRREFILASTAAATGALASQGCSREDAEMSYDEAVRETWHHTGRAPSDSLLLRRELVRYATLAPSSHNTQCWKFAVEQNSISIIPDLSRRTPAVDPDDHHLFVSLGCAAENLIQAARAHGLQGEAAFDRAPLGGVRVSLAPTKAVASPLFEAIPNRQSTRSEFDARPISTQELKLLEQAAAGTGVQLLLFTDKMRMEKILEYILRANTVQMSNRAFVEELKAWIRFNDAEAVRTRDGLFSRTTGNPTIPRWVGTTLFLLFFRPKSENEKYARQVRSSSGIAVFVSEASDAAQWVEVGRSYERFALQATALGIRNAHVNQPVEVAALRPQFADFLGVRAHRADLVVRFGRGPQMPRSLRRPVATVLV